jgi:hypothetical protein
MTRTFFVFKIVSNSSKNHFLFDDTSVLIETTFEGVDLSLGANPQLLTDHLQQTFVVAYQDHATLKNKKILKTLENFWDFSLVKGQALLHP